jgi:hypothetical protein
LGESPLVQAERISKQFGLNEEQAGAVDMYPELAAPVDCKPGLGDHFLTCHMVLCAEVLSYVAGWAAKGAGAADGTPPICLVHGPFGSGEAWRLLRCRHAQCATDAGA